MKMFRVLTTTTGEPKMVPADEWRQEMNGFLTFYAGEASVFAIRNEFVVSIETISPTLVPVGTDTRAGAINPVAA